MTNTNGVHPIHHGPVPANAALHAVSLLPDGEHRLSQYLAALPARTTGLTCSSWTALERPRPCTWADLEGEGWSFRLVFDPQGVAPGDALEAVSAGNPSEECRLDLEEHRAACLIFLTQFPADSTPWSRFLALCRVAWGWVDAGASLLALPEARLLLPRRLLLATEPEHLTPDMGYLFLTNGLAEMEKKGEESKLWLRTWGMGQFNLPDLAASLPSRAGEEERLERELESLRLLFETLPPAMIREGGVLPVGGTVQVGERTWTAVGEPGSVEYAFLRSRCGVQLFV
ncbi:hypothetical protein JST97_16950 [bacterium]|nr:hypothetical protein [bacterium]